ncbi:MFS transporter [Micromonospora sp. CPCC 205371]|nr:MFS transporter [Micromonospora sp. CPCC 205371]
MPLSDLQKAPATVDNRRWVVLGVLCASLLLIGMDVTVLHVAAPSLTVAVGPSATQLLWIVDAYALTVAASLVTAGTLADRFGRKRMLLWGFLVFALASAAAAFAPTPGLLIAARAALGVGGAMVMAATVAIIRVVFTAGRERALAIGAWTASYSVGTAVGPIVGGALLERYWWGAVFLVNLPVAAAAITLGAWLIPESRSSRPKRWDAGSAALSVAGLAGLVYTVKHLGEDGLARPSTAVVALVAAGLVAWFVRRQRRPEPLLDLTLLATRRVSTATIVVLASFASYIGLLFFLTQLLQLVAGYSPLRTGLALLPLAVANAAGSVLAPRMAARWGERLCVAGGLGLCAIAMAALAMPSVLDGPSGYAPLGALLFLVGLGTGVVSTLASDVIVSGARADQAGEAAAIQETSFELGAGLGIAVFGTVLAATYRANLVLPPHLPDGAADAAKQSLATAVHFSSGRNAPALAETAQSAFVTGLSAAAWSAAALLLAAAAMTAIRLR